MDFLIKYLLVNLLVSYFLEKSKVKMRVATIAHAVVFTVVLALLLVAQTDGFIATSVDYIIGEDAGAFLRASLASGAEGVIAPVMMIQLITAIFFFIAGFLLTARVAEYVRLKKAAPKKAARTAKKVVFTYKNNPLVFVNKLYIKKCVMRC